MAILNFQSIVWSKHVQVQLETISGARQHSDHTFSGEVAMGKELKILGLNRPTIRTYIPGTPITREDGSDNSQMLKIDQFKYYDYEIDDVIQAQSAGNIDLLTMEGTRGLADTANA